MKTINLFALIIGFITISSSCKQKIDFVEEPIDSSDVKQFGGKGQTWKMWNKIFVSCMKAEAFKDPFYMGVTNTIDLGSITDKDHESTIRVIDTSVFTTEELKKIIKVGVPASCNFQQSLTMDLNAFLNSEFKVADANLSSINAELAYAISTAKSTSIKVDGWQRDELITGALRDILNESTEPRKMKFKDDLLSEGNLILVRIAKINGFESTIELAREISADLEAKLKAGEVIAGIGDTGLKAKFNFLSKSSIVVKSDGAFYVFGKYMKAKKV